LAEEIVEKYDMKKEHAVNI